MYYVSAAPNGYAVISTQPPEEGFFVEVDALPDGDGILCINPDGTLFRVSPTVSDDPSYEPSIWDELDAAYQEGVDSV